MKKYITILIALCNTLTISAQKRTVIDGVITGAVNEKVILNRNSGFPNYELSFISETKTDDLGSFKTSFQCNEIGFILFYYRGLYHNIFIEPGDSLHLVYFERQDSITFSGRGGNNNSFNSAYSKKFENGIYSFISPREYSRTDPMYLNKLYDSLKNKEMDFYANNQVNTEVHPAYNRSIENNSSFIFTNNTSFSPAYNSYIKSQIMYTWAYQKLYCASNYERAKGNSILELIPDSTYYSFLKDIPIEDSAYLTSPAYSEFLYFYSCYQVKLDRRKNHWNDDNLKGLFWQKIYQVAKTSFHGSVRDAALAKIMCRCIDYADVDSIGNLMQDFSGICNDKEVKDYVENRYKLKLSAKQGNKAYDFTLSDKSGKQVSLHDFKGKVVYIDFSAPWCSPCRRELPYADSLVKLLNSKGVEFVFISVYDVIDSAYDASIIESSNAVHLYAYHQFKDSAVLGYNVTGIPRFVLVDRNGMIADLDAKRPSNGAKDEIEQLLKSNP